MTALTLSLLFLAAGLPAFGQVPTLAGGNYLNAVMIALIGSNSAFSARADFVVLDRDQKETADLPLAYAFAGGKMRMEFDLSQFKSAQAPAQFLANAKQYGMDQIVVISRPDRGISWSAYPHAKAYAEVTNSTEETAALSANYKIDKSPAGKETLDGHACEKNMVTLSGEKGEKLETTVWNATDLHAFPLQMQMPVDTNNTILIKFRDVKFTPPDRKQFDEPSSLTKYNSAEDLLNALSKRAAAAK